MAERPALVMIPCFAGAPWELKQQSHLRDWSMRTMRLPDDVDDLEGIVDNVLEQIRDLDSYVLVGDSFGAVVSIALAVRQPQALKGLVLSGGFARNPITSVWLKTLVALAPFFPGPFYRAMTLRVHAAQLRSVFDTEGEIPWSAAKTRAFFIKETPHRAYVSRVRAIEKADYTDKLSRINVPTLVLTPAEDRLIGREAAGVMLNGIHGSKEVVMPRTGHMFRFSHPKAYSEQVHLFLQQVFLDVAPSALARDH